MNRTQQIFLASALALGLSSSMAAAATMDRDSQAAASASNAHVVILDAHARVNKEYNFMMAQPQIYAAEAKAVIGKNPALASKLRSMNVEFNNIVGIVSSNDGTYSVLLR